MNKRPFDGGGLTAAEHLEAAVSKLHARGWNQGRWQITMHVENGRLVRVVATEWDTPPRRDTAGRTELDQLESEVA